MALRGDLPFDVYDITDVPSRFRDFIRVDDEEGCWLWSHRKSRNGYGRVYIFGKEWSAHRFVYELLVRPIGKSKKDMHHLCFRRHCVNPSHLQLRTRRSHNRHHKRKRRKL
jgi:hypothetical protein